MLSLDSQAAARMWRKVLVDRGFSERVIDIALAPGPRIAIERFVNQLIERSRDPGVAVARVPPRWRLAVAELVDELVAQDVARSGWPYRYGGAYRRLLCAHCRDFIPLECRRDARFCCEAHRVAAARRRAAGKAESAHGGRGVPFTGSRERSEIH